MQGQCRDLCYYVEKFSGGDSKPFLVELDQWSKTLTKRREVNSKQFYILSTAPIAHQPEYITECAKALFAAPKSFTRKEEAVIWDAADVANMAKDKKESVTEAVEIMRSCRKWAAACGLTPWSEPQAVGGHRLPGRQPRAPRARQEVQGAFGA